MLTTHAGKNGLRHSGWSQGMSGQAGLEELPTELSYERKVGGGERERRRDTIYHHCCGPSTLPTLSLFFKGLQKYKQYPHCFDEEIAL